MSLRVKAKALYFVQFDTKQNAAQWLRYIWRDNDNVEIYREIETKKPNGSVWFKCLSVELTTFDKLDKVKQARLKLEIP